jgi:hypothetical protein
VWKALPGQQDWLFECLGALQVTHSPGIGVANAHCLRWKNPISCSRCLLVVPAVSFSVSQELCGIQQHSCCTICVSKPPAVRLYAMCLACAEEGDGAWEGRVGGYVRGTHAAPKRQLEGE